MPKCSDFKSPLRKLKEDLLGKHPSSSSSTTIPNSHLNPDDLFAESFSQDDSQLRRPMNAFLLFCKRHRQVVRTRHPWLDNRACTKMLADMWGALDGDEKEKYLQLARECKAAFMKAHPDYKWSGPHRHAGGKVTNPGNITTRPPSTKENKAGITVGKLADPSQMGGLSLLLLAGQQETSTKRVAPSSDQHKTVRRSNSEPATNEREDDDSVKSKLFQFAEMCSDQLAMKPEHNSDSIHLSNVTIPVNNTTDASKDNTVDASSNNNNTIPLNSQMHFRLTSDNQGTEITNGSMRTEIKDEDDMARKGGLRKEEEEEGVMEANDGKKNETKDEEETEEGMTKIKTNNKKRKSEKSSKKKKKKKKKVLTVKDESEALSLSWPGALKGVFKKESKGIEEKKDEEEKEEEEKEKEGSLTDGEDSKSAGQRKSRRSCKGRLYRKLVDQGMLESLQRPERPFNCKKAWRHTNEGMSGFSDAEDEVFQPEDGKKARRPRKRTNSGSSVTCSDFDYGEINVEARLATLPQYAPEQFRTKKKSGLKSKKTSDIYKNAKFIKERGKSKVMRSLSSSEMTVTGSQKRKARKSSIMHLLPTKDPHSISSTVQSSPSPPRTDKVIGSKVKRSISDPQPFTLSDLAEVASMELKPCSSASTACTPGGHVQRPNLCLAAVTVS
ncbi:HMG box transcription factor BBX-like [Lytechinus pictus]|uniref:HMG box transcription factor BBX-like n=1 Tax=Lytechinus pictus TaxID=7653 RepID=UPI0030BA1A1D